MRSTFGGFESMRRALYAAQTSLDVTGQNIANVNTEGYTRQRVVQTAAPPDSGIYRFSEPTGANVGQGVNVEDIQRIKDEFLDIRYWKGSGELGGWDVVLSASQDIESIFDETTSDGLSAQLNDFNAKLQELAKYPESVEFSTITRSSGQKLVEILNQYASQLDEVRSQQVEDLKIVTGDINAIAIKIDQYNQQIVKEEMGRQSANELRDARDLLLDKLSAYGNITVEEKAGGAISVRLGSHTLVDADNLANPVNELAVDDDGSQVRLLWDDGNPLDVVRGQIKGHLSMLNGQGGFADLTATPAEDDSHGIPYFTQVVNSFASRLATTLNQINEQVDAGGTSLGPKPLFNNDGSGVFTAANIAISDQWRADSQYITRSQSADPLDAGRNDNVMRMLDAMSTNMPIITNFDGTFEEFANAISSEIAVDVNFNKDIQKSAASILQSIYNQRESVKGVSLDEESANMLKYQKAYTAAARVMTALDEMVDTIVSKMGLVGR